MLETKRVTQFGGKQTNKSGQDAMSQFDEGRGLVPAADCGSVFILDPDDKPDGNEL